MNCGNLGEGSGAETFHKTLIWSKISQIFEIHVNQRQYKTVAKGNF